MGLMQISLPRNKDFFQKDTRKNMGNVGPIFTGHEFNPVIFS